MLKIIFTCSQPLLLEVFSFPYLLFFKAFLMCKQLVKFSIVISLKFL